MQLYTKYLGKNVRNMENQHYIRELTEHETDELNRELNVYSDLKNLEKYLKTPRKSMK